MTRIILLAVMLATTTMPSPAQSQRSPSSQDQALRGVQPIVEGQGMAARDDEAALNSPDASKPTAADASIRSDSLDPSTTFTFIAPPDIDQSLGGFECGIRFGMRQVISNVEGGRYGELKRTGPATAELTTFVGSQEFEVGKGVLHDLAVAVEKDEQKCAVSLSILTAKPFKRKGFLNMWSEPPFTAADILIQTHKFLYRPSFISAYPAAALMANFDRLAIKSCNNVGVPLSRQLPIELRGDVSRMYCIKVDGQNIPVVPECHPYRDGSQCTVLALLIAEPMDKLFDARPSAAKLRASIESILSD